MELYEAVVQEATSDVLKSLFKASLLPRLPVVVRQGASSSALSRLTVVRSSRSVRR